MKKTKTKKSRWHYLLLAAGLVTLGCSVTFTILYPQFKQVINGALLSPVAADEEYVSKALENSKQVNIQLEEEGSVLLQNKNNLLPLKAETTNINVYSILSTNYYVGGTGSGSTGTKGISFKEALENDGFKVNDTIYSMLEKAKFDYSGGAEVGGKVAGQYELDIQEYEKTMSFADAKAFSEYAICMFGTNGGEGTDGDRGEVNSLQLGENEITLLKRLHDEGFKIICLINSSYVMEPYYFKEYADSVLWIGATGLYGMQGVANLLSGKSNPSGRLPDTWMYEMETSSSYYTTDNANSQFVKENGGTLASYTNYNEGIYVGYRYYETADKEGCFDSVDNEFGKGYEGIVCYPFGYGLSYTSFEESITSYQYKDSTHTFQIRVKNTGEKEGKHSIELYVSKPYTNGGVEVPQVELIAFDKTESLAPGKEETLSVSFTDEDLSVYDESADNGKGAYVLLGGDYSFYLADSTLGAHCWKEVTQDDSAHYRKADIKDIVYSGDNKRSSDCVLASNLLKRTDNDTGLSIQDDRAGYKELSRKNRFENAEDTISKEANPNGKITLKEDDELYQLFQKTYGAKTYKNYNVEHLKDNTDIESSLLNQEKKYTLQDLYTTDSEGNPLFVVHTDTGEKEIRKEVDYNDPRWEDLLNQMSLDELDEFLGRGGYGSIAIDSIGKASCADYDGPTGYSNFLKANMGIKQETTGFCCEPIMAATRNEDLLKEYGKAVGKEGNAFGNQGWYAPGMNIHRTPFEGRTGEYFSEDPLLTGLLGSDVSYGAFEMGIYTYAKHFAFNEIETHRGEGMNCFMSEQVAREIYLKPFEIGIKRGKIKGLMSSFMFVNGQWNGANYNLMTNIVRKEWGFNGSITTDLASNMNMGTVRALCGGTDTLLATGYAKNNTYAWVRCDDISSTEEGIKAMKRAAKHILYTVASASLHREVKAENSSGFLYFAFLGFGYGITAILLILFFIRLLYCNRGMNHEKK